MGGRGRGLPWQGASGGGVNLEVTGSRWMSPKKPECPGVAARRSTLCSKVSLQPHTGDTEQQSTAPSPVLHSPEPDVAPAQLHCREQFVWASRERVQQLPVLLFPELQGQGVRNQPSAHGREQPSLVRLHRDLQTPSRELPKLQFPPSCTGWKIQKHLFFHSLKLILVQPHCRRERVSSML